MEPRVFIIAMHNKLTLRAIYTAATVEQGRGLK
jgi:hypothetical protein